MIATTVANKWNGNQMQIWLPFVFYTPLNSIRGPSWHLLSLLLINANRNIANAL